MLKKELKYLLRMGARIEMHSFTAWKGISLDFLLEATTSEPGSDVCHQVITLPKDTILFSDNNNLLLNAFLRKIPSCIYIPKFHDGSFSNCGDF